MFCVRMLRVREGGRKKKEREEESLSLSYFVRIICLHVCERLYGRVRMLGQRIRRRSRRVDTSAVRQDSLLGTLRQIHRDHVPEVALRRLLARLLLAHVLPFHGLAGDRGRARRRRTGRRRRRVDAAARRACRFGFYATAARTVTRYLRTWLGLVIRRRRTARHGGTAVSAVSVHVVVDGAWTAAAHVMTHGIVPGIGSGRGCRGRRGATHVTAVRDVLLVRGCRIVHHVTVGHVTVGHLIDVARQLRLLRSTAGANLSLIDEHTADTGNAAAERKLLLLE